MIVDQRKARWQHKTVCPGLAVSIAPLAIAGHFPSGSYTSATSKLAHKAHRAGEAAFCFYVPKIWNLLPINLLTVFLKNS